MVWRGPRARRKLQSSLVATLDYSVRNVKIISADKCQNNYNKIILVCKLGSVIVDALPYEAGGKEKLPNFIFLTSR